MSDQDIGDELTTTELKVLTALEHAVARLPIETRIAAALVPGINSKIDGDCVEFTLQATGQTLVVVDLEWLNDDSQGPETYNPEFVELDAELPPDLRS